MQEQSHLSSRYYDILAAVLYSYAAVWMHDCEIPRAKVAASESFLSGLWVTKVLVAVNKYGMYNSRRIRR